MRKTSRPLFNTVLLLTLLLTVWACSPQPGTSASATPGPAASSPDHHHHEHEAPHGGTLVRLGDEFAHVEFVLEPSTGDLTAYILDGEARNAVQLNAPSLTLNVTLPQQEEVELNLSPVADELTGETEQSTSRFTVRSEKLQGVSRFEAVLKEVAVKGQTFSEIAFVFPEGNENHEHHEHGEGEHH